MAEAHAGRACSDTLSPARSAGCMGSIVFFGAARRPPPCADDRLAARVSSEAVRAEDARLEGVAQATRARLDQRAAGGDAAGLLRWACGRDLARAPGA